MKDRKFLELDKKLLNEAANIFRAINHKLRQQLILFVHEKESVSVSEIYKTLRIEQSVASQHLGILRKAGIMHNERRGKTIIYSVNYERVDQIVDIARKLIRKKELGINN